MREWDFAYWVSNRAGVSICYDCFSSWRRSSLGSNWLQRRWKGKDKKWKEKTQRKIKTNVEWQVSGERYTRKMTYRVFNGIIRRKLDVVSFGFVRLKKKKNSDRNEGPDLKLVHDDGIGPYFMKFDWFCFILTNSLVLLQHSQLVSYELESNVKMML